MFKTLEGHVAVVTGAAGGIGLACVRRLLGVGARVVAADLDLCGLPAVGVDRLIGIRADLRDAGAADEVAAATVNAFGRLDILVNNAGVAPPRGGFLDVGDADWHETLDLNLLGYVRAARAVIPAMLAQDGGSLIHIASEAGRMPNPRLPDYSVSKSAVLMLSKVLAGEFTAQGIRSNTVSPAFIRTPIYDRPGGLADTLAAEYGTDRESALGRYVHDNRIPAGRLGTADEVAGLVAYLASEDAAFVSGADFRIDGGVTPVV